MIRKENEQRNCKKYFPVYSYSNGGRTLFRQYRAEQCMRRSWDVSEPGVTVYATKDS